MIEVRETGGARIGNGQASWPFAKLIVTRDRLELKASIIGNLVFKPGDIVSLEPGGFFGGGLKINHTVPQYADKVWFAPLGSSKKLKEKIEQTGFLTNTDPVDQALVQDIVAAQSQGGVPVKIGALIAIAVIWNAFFFVDIAAGGLPPLRGAFWASAFVLLTCILLLTSEPVRRLVLKEGRTIDDIKVFVYLLMFVCTGTVLGVGSLFW